MHDLAPLVTTFFVRYLPTQQAVSPNTLTSYRDTFKLLLRFIATKHPRFTTLRVEDITYEDLLEFLEMLEKTRHNSVRTRNARLAAIHSFFRYLLDDNPELAQICQRVLAIPSKKTAHPVLS